MAVAGVVSDVMLQLSTYMAAAPGQRLPADVAERAKLHLLDTLAAMVSGSRLVPGKRAIGHVRTLGGTREATVVGTSITTNAVNAALANGMFAHADETDDSHPASITHPGAGVVPAALALAERNRRSGAALLRAVVLGYDIGTRLTMSLDLKPFYARGHHPPCFGGLFGAAAAAGAMAKLDAERMRYLLSYTAQQASGLSSLFRDPEHVEKAFDMGGMPAHNGVQAALLAAHGFTGVSDVFSGERNFFFAFSSGADPARMTRELGSTYEIMNTSIKKWPVGGPILGPLDAVETLMQKHAFKADEVEKMVVRVAKDRVAIADGRAMVDINLQHMMAVMLIDGTVNFKTSHDFKRVRDPEVAKLRQRIELVGDLDMPDPKMRWHGKVEITLRDGRTFEHFTRVARGSGDNPMTREEEDAKALDLLAPVLGKQRAQKLIATVWDMEKLKDARKLGRLCRAG
jgi:2-methylcitrate dehydratase PrpD